MPLPLLAMLAAKKVAGAVASKAAGAVAGKAAGTAGKIIPAVIQNGRKVSAVDQVVNHAFSKAQDGYADKANTIGDNGFVAPSPGKTLTYANALEDWASRRRPWDNPVTAAGFSTPTLVGQKRPTLAEATDQAVAGAAEESGAAVTDPRYQAWLDRYNYNRRARV